jgi:hypothetical protein
MPWVVTVVHLLRAEPCVCLICAHFTDEETEVPNGNETYLSHRAQLDTTWGLGESLEGWCEGSLSLSCLLRESPSAAAMSVDEAVEDPKPS